MNQVPPLSSLAPLASWLVSRLPFSPRAVAALTVTKQHNLTSNLARVVLDAGGHHRESESQSTATRREYDNDNKNDGALPPSGHSISPGVLHESCFELHANIVQDNADGSSQGNEGREWEETSLFFFPRSRDLSPRHAVPSTLRTPSFLEPCTPSSNQHTSYLSFDYEGVVAAGTTAAVTATNYKNRSDLDDGDVLALSLPSSAVGTEKLCTRARIGSSAATRLALLRNRVHEWMDGMHHPLPPHRQSCTSLDELSTEAVIPLYLPSLNMTSFSAPSLIYTPSESLSGSNGSQGSQGATLSPTQEHCAGRRSTAVAEESSNTFDAVAFPSSSGLREAGHLPDEWHKFFGREVYGEDEENRARKAHV